jgi:preprotein translocase subunit YajC
MFISSAFAAEAVEVGSAVAPEAAAGGASAFWMNMGLIAVMFIAFYFILIRPQQRRMQEQQKMVDSLKKGDKVITAGGLLGKISKLTNEREVEVELSKDVKVKVLRYTLQVDSSEADLAKKADDAVKASKE